MTSSSRTPGVVFTVVRRGFDREEVGHAISRLEAEIAVLRADREAAVDRAHRAAGETEDARHRVAELEQRIAELTRTPTTSGEMSARLREMLAQATTEADGRTGAFSPGAAESRAVGRAARGAALPHAAPGTPLAGAGRAERAGHQKKSGAARAALWPDLPLLLHSARRAAG